MSLDADRESLPTLSGSRRAVLYAVRRHGEATAEQVAAQLDITVSGARQHLSALTDDGLVETAELTPDERKKRGRRALVYSATTQADSLFPKAYGELTNELLSYVVDSDPDMLEALFVKRRERRIEAARTRLASKEDLPGKVDELTRILDEDGYMATWETTAPGVYAVVEHNSAIWAVAQRYGQACASEIDFIRAVLPGANVERVQHMVAGAKRCAYAIRADTTSAETEELSMELSPEVRAVIESGRLAHFVTINADGRPHATIVWVGLDGDDIVIGKLFEDQKTRNIRRDPRVSFSIEADGDQRGMQHYLVVEGTARVDEGGAPEVLQRLAQTYIGPGAKFPPMPDPPDGFVIRVTADKVRGMGPWGTQFD